jgi:hypothetical protein
MSVAQFQEMWQKLNANERLAAQGGGVVVVGWVLGLVLNRFGFGADGFALIGAIVLFVLYYLKYAPNQTMTWPAPLQTIALVVSALVALSALASVATIGLFLGLGLIASIVTLVGGVMMLLGTWRDYQAMPKTPSAPPPTAPPTAPPPTAPPPPPPAV